MATRVQRSRIEVAPIGAQLPTYEPPTFALNPNAQRALALLEKNDRLKALREKFSDSQATISLGAAAINDALTGKEASSRKRKNAGDEDTLEQSLDDLRIKVEKMTQRMDESMRKLIDGQHNVDFTQASLQTAAESVRNAPGTQASTQLRTQRRRRRYRTPDSEDNEGEEVEDEEYEEFTPTDPSGSTQAAASPFETFLKRLDDSKLRHQSHSLYLRYAENNDYKDFKRIVHDARHPDGEIPVPDPMTWFNEEGVAPAPGVTSRGHGTYNDEDNDDDIAVQRAKISTKCPLTLREFDHAVTAQKCGHSFEKTAIMALISQSPTRGQVQCPVGGCNEHITKSDLHVDAVLVRKIKRIQRARELEEEEAEEAAQDGDRARAHVIGDDNDDDDDAADVDDLVVAETKPVKNEPRATGVSRVNDTHPPSTQRPPRSSAVVDLDDESSEEGSADGEDEDTP